MTTPEQNQAEASLRAYARHFIKNGTQDERDAIVSSYRVRRLKLRPEQVQAIVQEIIEERKSENQIGESLPSEDRSSSPASTPTQRTGQPTRSGQNQPIEATESTPDQSSTKNSVTQSTNRIEAALQSKTDPEPAVKSGEVDVSQPGSNTSQPAATTPPTASNSTSSISTAPTSMPPKDAEYLKHLEEYEDAYLEAMQADLEALRRGELPPTEASNARLRKLIEDYDLSKSDVADSMVRASQRFLNSSSSSNPSSPAASGSAEAKAQEPPAPTLNLPYPELFEQLEKDLKNKNYRNADAVTFAILQKLINPTQTWLNAASLEEFSKTVKQEEQQAIQKIDQLWTQASAGNFGFSRQLGIFRSLEGPDRNKSSIDYRQRRAQALVFSQQVGWWIEELRFFKLYDQHLNFTDAAPVGHLPALWFWEMPWLAALGQGGIHLLGLRGGYRVDASRIDAFMHMLNRSGVTPASHSQLSSTRPPRTVERGRKSKNV
ncbi:MAG: GUN4 domain-containing protein [Leptolyngbya sp. IPPAS B-1204]|nr:MAG: hypothetical protein EDM05_19560 [Leptolyngbya sp. IPPAS B-1204]